MFIRVSIGDNADLIAYRNIEIELFPLLELAVVLKNVSIKLAFYQNFPLNPRRGLFHVINEPDPTEELCHLSTLRYQSSTWPSNVHSSSSLSEK